jgi:calcineurin-like phosphoesterase
MTGPYESILGRKIEPVTEATTTFRPMQFQVATGDVRISGAVVEVNVQDGKATRIEPLVLAQAELEANF